MEKEEDQELDLILQHSRCLRSADAWTPALNTPAAMTQNPAEAEASMWFSPGSWYSMPQTQSTRGNTLTNTRRSCFLSQPFSFVGTTITDEFRLGSDGSISTLLVFLLVQQGIESAILLYMTLLQLWNCVSKITALGKRKAPHKKEGINSWFNEQARLT